MAKIISDRRMTQKKVEGKLDAIKDKITDSYQYFSGNYERFNHYRNFVFRTSLSQDDISLMKELGKPQLEFNILEAYLSRLRGEFSKQEPSLEVRASDDAQKVDPQLLNLLEAHIRAILFDSNRDNMAYNIYTDILSGGFSAMEVYTDYIHPKSFKQKICIQRCFDPTLVGFDKMAQTSHKGDGDFCFKLYPMTKTEFERKYGTKYTATMKFTRNIKQFNWSYCTDNQEIVLVGEHYEKKKKMANIVQLVTGEVMTTQEYDQLVEDWNSHMIIQAPTVVGKSRQTELTTIGRYILVENGVLEYNETDYKYFPLIFVDGNSVMLRTDGQGSATQLTRPYVYHAEGVQKLKNFAGCTLANELENMVQHKWIVQKEAIPPEYKEAYVNNQQPSVLVYNGFKDNSPQTPLNPPQPVPRIPCPPEVTNTFSMADQITQAILGSYDASLGINNNQLSGVAIVEGATQSNAASMPYIVGYLKALNRVGELILDLIPKYYIHPRNIPVRTLNGKSSYAPINQEGASQMNFNSEEIEIKIEAGVNFEIQQSRALESLTGLMKISQPLNAYLTETPVGVETLLDNINIRGIDSLKQGVAQYMQKRDQQQQQMQQMQMQMNPVTIKREELQQKAQQSQTEAELDAARISIGKQDSDTKRLLALQKIGQMADESELTHDKIQAENTRSAVDVAVKVADMKHKHAMEVLNLHHENRKHTEVLEEKKDKKIGV